MSRKGPCPQQQGFVLIVVLGMTIAIMALVLSFNRQSRISLHIGDAMLRRSQAWACAQGGLELVCHLLSDGDDISVAKQTHRLLLEPQEVSMAAGACRIQLVDESGKIQINQLKFPDGKLNRVRIDQLLKLLDTLNRLEPEQPRLGYGMVPALIDWIDSDDEVTVLPFISRENRGAESASYPDRQGCANRPLIDITELRRVRGVSAEAFERVAPYLTIYGDGQVNLNSAPLPVILALSEHIDLSVARLLEERRRRHPLESLDDIEGIPGITGPVYKDLQQAGMVGQGGPYYQVRVTGMVAAQRREIQAHLKKNDTSQQVDIVRYEERRTGLENSAAGS
jgi:general secretion pathway protein K